jgi:hypothetical protein
MNKNPNELVEQIMDRYLSVGIHSIQIVFIPKTIGLPKDIKKSIKDKLESGTAISMIRINEDY